MPSVSTLGAIAVVASLSAAGPARAQEIATPCTPDAQSCATAPLAFSRDFGIDPIGFDTGWVPQGSPIQVHVFAQLFAETHVALGGHLLTAWPEALTFATPGEPGAGALSIHYGVDVGAQAKVTVTVLGQTYSWTGDIPYFPQFDYHVQASGTFDPWAFNGFTVDGSTKQQTLAQVSVKDFINVSIPGLDGGFELDSYTELKATYKTHRMVVAHTDGTAVSGGPILTESGLTTELADTSPGSPALGASTEEDVHPEGSVTYEGTLHLIPAFYIDTWGPNYTIPVADIPIPFTITQDDWIFDPVRVHTPLPDIALDGDPVDTLAGEEELDLGHFAVDSTAENALVIHNAGEAKLWTHYSLDGNAAFSIATDTGEIAPGGADNLNIDFAGTDPGDYSATLTILSNDPDEPSRSVILSAHVDTPPPPPPPAEGTAYAQANAFPQGGGCLCTVGRATDNRTSGGVLLASAIAIGAAAHRRGASRRRRGEEPKLRGRD